MLLSNVVCGRSWEELVALSGTIGPNTFLTGSAMDDVQEYGQMDWSLPIYPLVKLIRQDVKVIKAHVLLRSH